MVFILLIYLYDINAGIEKKTIPIVIHAVNLWYTH